MKMLTVYYSWSNGNTEKIARELAEACDSDLEQIETEVPYEGSYEAVVEQGKKEVDSGYEPAIRPLKHDPKDYDVIAAGTPTWWYTMAPAVKSFFSKYDLNGKTVIPFMTNGGWPGSVIRDMTSAAEGTRVICSMEVQFDSAGGARQMTGQKEVENWINEVRKHVKA